MAGFGAGCILLRVRGTDLGVLLDGVHGSTEVRSVFLLSIAPMVAH